MKTITPADMPTLMLGTLKILAKSAADPALAQAAKAELARRVLVGPARAKKPAVPFWEKPEPDPIAHYRQCPPLPGRKSGRRRR